MVMDLEVQREWNPNRDENGKFAAEETPECQHDEWLCGFTIKRVEGMSRRFALVVESVVCGNCGATGQCLEHGRVVFIALPIQPKPKNVVTVAVEPEATT